MSNLGKILLYVALAGAIAAGVAGGLIIKKRGEDAAAIQAANTARATTEQKLKAETAALEAEKTAHQEAEDKATQANAKLEDLQKNQSDLQKAATEAASALAKAQQDAKDAEEKFKKLNDTLQGADPAQLKADVAKAQADAQAAQAEEKILQDQTDGLKKQLADKIDEINRSKTATNLPGVSGKVTFVDKTWNFVVLNVGLSNGVVPNGELIVYRGRTFLGKLRITKAEENDSVAEILPDTKGDIQVGDIVLN
jgi:hypothetical protein